MYLSSVAGAQSIDSFDGDRSDFFLVLTFSIAVVFCSVLCCVFYAVFRQPDICVLNFLLFYSVFFLSSIFLFFFAYIFHFLHSDLVRDNRHTYYINFMLFFFLYCRYIHFFKSLLFLFCYVHFWSVSNMQHALLLCFACV